MAPRSKDAERTCLVTREAQPPDGLIRFVVDPSGQVIPDIREKLPGRGAWVGGRRDLVETAIRKKLFARAFRREVTVDEDLAGQVDRLLEDQALSALSIARKAGLVRTGFGKCESALASEDVAALMHALEAAEDGKRKLAQALRRRQALERERQENAAPRRPVRVIDGFFSGSQLDLALGGANVIHAALLAGGASGSFLGKVEALARYRSRDLNLKEDGIEAPAGLAP
ncbi:hypothetical protein HDIA_4672 [Hartmannibacter diazotrophicus]|uniref:YlxR domain-containing protein n=1 Tax=Hartmannibacter diazotrophicus TaxID=1482074 RepID=A0A2C9DD92_9HYPH|nr:RNA-binding protein [Hartmannibacter diazotrophicus]SON58213.1 hypothetical protein HDIA_4672 [Hartmannibacter diazotrophicus]